MEDMDEIFARGSVKKLWSSKLRFVDVDWPRGTWAAANVMPAGGRVSMNIWVSGAAEREALKAAFEQAGFKDVELLGDGVGTILSAVR
jgi:hypothetical protein